MIDGKPFTDLLGEIEDGQLLRDLTDAAYRISRAAGEVRKEGMLTLKLKFMPTGRSSIQIDAKFDEKVPEHDRPSTTFFLDRNGTLLRDDPAQEKLPLQRVEDDRMKPVKRAFE